MKKYELEVHNGRQIRIFDESIDESTIEWITNQTFEQCDNEDSVAWFDTEEEALAALSKKKNSFSKIGRDLVDTEIYQVIEWEVDEDGEPSIGKPIGIADWEAL